MSRFKHTPGPWIADIDNPLSVIPGHSIKAKNINFTPVGIVHAHQGSKGPAEGIANARLIARTPELLVRLCNIIDQAVPCEGDRNHIVPAVFIKEARELIEQIKKGGA